MRVFNEIRFDNLRGDLFGGVTAAVVALPMALAFGVASGAGPAAGLYGAVLVGLFAALFGSTPTLISEPTGPMTVVMTAVITNLITVDPEQGLAMAFTVVMMAGILQILFGLLGLGRYVTLMPYTVVSGFMTGIGLILISLQLGPFLGQPTPPGGVLGTIGNLPRLIENIKPAEFGLAAMTLLLILLYPKRLKRYLPPQLLALIIGTLVSVLFLSDMELRRIGEIPTGLPKLQMPVFSLEHWRLMLIDALVLAVLGCIDALLTSVIAESLTRREHHPSKELIGQGLGNLASGLFGGIAGAGATMGTVVNIQSGAKTALSGITRALILLVVVLWAAGLTAQIPLAVLAGIAFKVGLDIIDWSFLKRAHRVSVRAALIMYAVIALTVFVDLIWAVAVGVFVANVLTIDRLSKLQSRSLRAIQRPGDSTSLSLDEQAVLERAGGRILLFKFGGPLIFGLAKEISRQYAVLEGHDVLILDFTEVPAVGVSSALTIERMVLEDLDAGRQVVIAGAEGDVKQRLEQLGLLARLPPEQIVSTTQEALALAERCLQMRSRSPSRSWRASPPNE